MFFRLALTMRQIPNEHQFLQSFFVYFFVGYRLRLSLWSKKKRVYGAAFAFSLCRSCSTRDQTLGNFYFTQIGIKLLLIFIIFDKFLHSGLNLSLISLVTIKYFFFCLPKDNFLRAFCIIFERRLSEQKIDQKSYSSNNTSFVFRFSLLFSPASRLYRLIVTRTQNY